MQTTKAERFALLTEKDLEFIVKQTDAAINIKDLTASTPLKLS